MRVLLSTLVLLVLPGLAQSPVFIEQTGLLDDSDIVDPPFSSSMALGVVDMNGDRKDDIVRLHDKEELSLEYQAAPGALFGHLDLGSLATDDGWSLCAADVDGNGFNDLVVGELYTGHDCYLANASGTGFSMSDLPTPVGIVQDVIFADLNNDGLIDIFACDDEADLHKYRNTGGGNFVFDDSLVPTLLTAVGHSDNEGNYAIIQTDYDGDGDLDYYLSKCWKGDNDSESPRRINRMFQNDGNNNYTDLSGAAGLDDGAQTWCADLGDIDNDGDLDCFVLNHEGSFSEDSVLYENDGAGGFSPFTTADGLAGLVDFRGLQAVFRDFNNDGWLDLLVSSMEIVPATYGYYQNDGDGTFTRLTGVFKHASAGNPDVTRIYSFAVGDLNQDGFLDLYASRGFAIGGVLNEADLLLFNQGNSNGFLSLTLVGSQSNPNGIGARLEAHGPWGVQVRELRGGEGYGIMNSLNVHFGLGAATQIDQLVVRWPSGVVDDIMPVPGNRFATLHEGTGRLAFSYADWIGGFFPGGGPDAEADADPDRDGLANIIEQILGTDPTMPNGMEGIAIAVVSDGEQEFAEVMIDRVPVQDVSMELESSTNGTSWAADPTLQVVEDTPTRLVVRKPLAGLTGPWLVRLRAGT